MKSQIKRVMWTVWSVVALFACSEHNPDNVLNPESVYYDASMSADANDNGIADGLEPYLDECGGNAKCAAEMAWNAKQGIPSSSSADAMSSGDGASSGSSSSSDDGTSSQGTSSGNPESSSSAGVANSSSSTVVSQHTLTVLGGVILVNGLTTGSYNVGTVLTLVANPFEGGLDQCKGGWSYTNGVVGDLVGDTVSFAMPAMDVSFEMQRADCPGMITDVRDGALYSYAALSATPNKLWLMDNMNYAVGNGEYCYNNTATNCATYGRLYQFSALTAVCPAGWRVPTPDEFKAALNPDDLLGLQATGRYAADAMPAFNYQGQDNKKTYWVQASASDQEFAKNCNSGSGEDCGFVITNEQGTWKVASDSKEKAYPVRCIQE